MTTSTARTALSSTDYTATDRDAVHATVTALTRELSGLLADCAPDGDWQPTQTDILRQLDEADVLLTRMYRALGRARRRIDAVDQAARRRFLHRTRASEKS